MTKRILALVIAAVLTAITFTGCLEKGEPKTSDPESGHKHVFTGDKYENVDDSFHSFICDECGEKITEEHEATIPVPQGEAGHSFKCRCGYDSGTTVRHSIVGSKCERCGWNSNPDHQHEYVLVSDNGDGTHTRYCECNGGDTFVEPHNLEWITDKSGHYQLCACQYSTEKEDHKYDADGKCSVCGLKDHTCTPVGDVEYDENYHSFECHCGEWVQEVHSFGTDRVGDDKNHFFACNGCAYKVDVEPHVFMVGGFPADCNCGYKLPTSLGLEFELNGNSYTLTGIGSCKDKIVVIPQTHNGKPVTAIGSSAFEGNTNIEYVVIPNGVNSIGSSAFAGCTSLKRVNIPTGVTVIRDNTFASCTSLEKIDCPAALTKIEMFAFSGCVSFRGLANSVTGDEVNEEKYLQLTSIGDNAFYGCKALVGENVVLAQCEYIGNGAFSGCSSIKKVHLCVEILGGNAFSGCTSLRTVNIMNYLNDENGFEVGTFSDCTSLNKLIMSYNFEGWTDFFANSTVDEEMGLSWYENTPDFTVDFGHFDQGTQSWDIEESMKISEIYDYLNENYWQ